MIIPTEYTKIYFFFCFAFPVLLLNHEIFNMLHHLILETAERDSMHTINYENNQLGSTIQ